FVNNNDIPSGIFLFSETYFTNRGFFNIFKCKTCYTLHRDGTAHGGTAVIINEMTLHSEINKYKEDSTSMKIKDACGSTGHSCGILSTVTCSTERTI
ncbi:hypothetical protein WH47_08487, partial [Habropoda laboriosa]